MILHFTMAQLSILQGLPHSKFLNVKYEVVGYTALQKLISLSMENKKEGLNKPDAGNIQPYDSIGDARPSPYRF